MINCLFHISKACNITCSPNATCKEGQCMCDEGYTGDGVTCYGKFYAIVLMMREMSN